MAGDLFKSPSPSSCPSTGPPPSSGFCRRSCWARRVTSTSTRTTYSTWLRDTDKVPTPPFTSPSSPRSAALLSFSPLLPLFDVCPRSLDSSPKQREAGDAPLQVQNQTRLLRHTPKSLVWFYKPMDQRSGVHRVCQQGCLVSIYDIIRAGRSSWSTDVL